MGRTRMGTRGRHHSIGGDSLRAHPPASPHIYTLLFWGSGRWRRQESVQSAEAAGES